MKKKKKVEEDIVEYNPEYLAPHAQLITITTVMAHILLKHIRSEEVLELLASQEIICTEPIAPMLLQKFLKYSQEIQKPKYSGNPHIDDDRGYFKIALSCLNDLGRTDKDFMDRFDVLFEEEMGYFI